MNLPPAMRDPSGNREAYDAAIADMPALSTFVGESDVPLPIRHRVWKGVIATPDFAKRQAYQYASGASLLLLQDEITRSLPHLVEGEKFTRAEGPAVETEWPEIKDFRGVGGSSRRNFSMAALALLLLKTGHEVQQWSELVARSAQRRNYLLDVLTKSFVPQHPLASKYKPDRITAPFTEPVLRALACAPGERAAAMATCMKNWARVMRPWGLKPNLDTRPGHDKLFADFAFEVALAVCAYDIDDTAFANHPYYPRDLVAYYRSTLRNTRDAWRPLGQGAGVEIVGPPPPKKTDLAKSKKKGVARWVDLACDGDDNAAASVLEVSGKPRTIDDIGALMQALAQEQHGVHADIKDDDTVAIQAGSLAASRALGEFEPAAGPPFGPARCTVVLRELATLAQRRDYRLFELDNGDDAWHAVAVQAAFADEFLALGKALGMRSRLADIDD